MMAKYAPVASPQQLYVACFPKFDGSGLRKWLGECEDFFYLNNIPLEFQVKIASDHLVGIARKWYDNYMRTRYGLAPFWFEFIVDISSELAEFDHHPTVGHDFYAKSGYVASQVSCVSENYYFAMKESAEIVADYVFEEMPQRIKCPQPDSFGDNLEGGGAVEHNEVLLVHGNTMSDSGNDLNVVVDNVFDEMPMKVGSDNGEIIVVTEEKETGDDQSAGTEVADIFALNVFDKTPHTDTLPENVRFTEEDVVDIVAPKPFDETLEGENGPDYHFVKGRLTNYVAHKPLHEMFIVFNHLGFQLAREIMMDLYFVVNLSKGVGYLPSESLLETDYSYVADNALLNSKSCILLFLIVESRDGNEPVLPMITFDPGGSIITDRSHEVHPFCLGRAIFRVLRGTFCVEKHFLLQFESAYLSCATEGLHSATILNGCLATTLLEGCPPISLYDREVFWGNRWSCYDVDFPIPLSDIGSIYEQYCVVYPLQHAFVLNFTTTHVSVHEYWHLIVVIGQIFYVNSWYFTSPNTLVFTEMTKVMSASLAKMLRRVIEFTLITSELVFSTSNVRMPHHNADDEIWVDDCKGMAIPFTALGKLRAKDGVVNFFRRGSSTCQTDEADVASVLVCPFIPWKPPWTHRLMLKMHYEQYLSLSGEYINLSPSMKAYRDGLETLTTCRILYAHVSSNASLHDDSLPQTIIDEAFIFDPGGHDAMVVYIFRWVHDFSSMKGSKRGVYCYLQLKVAVGWYILSSDMHDKPIKTHDVAGDMVCHDNVEDIDDYLELLLICLVEHLLCFFRSLRTRISSRREYCYRIL